MPAGLSSEYEDKAFRNLICRRVQIDEIWAFSYCKEKQLPTAKKAPDQAGDLWTFVALDSDTKLVPSWMVGSRDPETARAFVNDLAPRISTRIQLTSDGFRPYLVAVVNAFEEVDYAMLVKHYDAAAGAPGGEALLTHGGYEHHEGAHHRQAGRSLHQHQPHRTPEPDHADAHAPVHPADQRLQQEGPESRPRGCAAFHALQLLQDPHVTEVHPGDASRGRARAMGYCGYRADY